MSSSSDSNSTPSVSDLAIKRDYSPTRLTVVRLTALLLLLVYLYYPALHYLVDTWWTRDDYSFGFLIPWISLYLVWLCRDQLMLLERHPAMGSGFLVMSVSGMLLIIGRTGGLVRLEVISLVVEVAGLVILMLGRRMFRALALPICYLGLMVPFFDEVLASLNWHFQLLTARMAGQMLFAIGVPVQINKNYLTLPSIVLEVAAGCSGIRYLISIVAFGVPLAYIKLHRWWARLLLVISAVMIAIAANWFRVVLIGIWSYMGGKVVHGPLHLFHAVILVWVGYGALFLNSWLISKWEEHHQKSSGLSSAQGGVAGFSRVSTMELRRSWVKPWGLAFVVLIAIASLLAFSDRGPVPLGRSLSVLPSELGGWIEGPLEEQSPPVRVDGADVEVFKSYNKGTNQTVFLFIAYFESQRQGKEVVSYRLRPFYEAASFILIGVPGESPKRVCLTKMMQGSQILQIVFWYDLNGRIVSGRREAKFYTIWDAIRRGRTNGALIMVYEKDLTAGKPPESLKDFAANLIPYLKDSLPR